MHRFYLPHFNQPVLGAEEAHHARHVLRVKVGATVNVFDGHGREAQCQVTAISDQAVKLKLLTQSSSPPLPCRFTLAQAIPKKNMDWIVQKATELGVATIVPLVSERTLVQVNVDAKKLDRWRGIMLDACKQCGNNWLPELRPPQEVREFLATAGRFDLQLIGSLQPDAQPLKTILAGGKKPASVLILIGPEGDFTPAELAEAKSAGCRPLSLGPLVLRADTAALYTLSILHHELQTR